MRVPGSIGFLFCLGHVLLGAKVGIVDCGILAGVILFAGQFGVV